MDTTQLQQNMAEDLGISQLPQAAQEEIITKLGETILKAVSLKILEVLPEESRPEFDTLSEANNEEAINVFLRGHIPHLDELIAKATQDEIEAFKKFRAELIQ